MQSIRIHIFGSKVFYNLFNELNLNYSLNFFEKIDKSYFLSENFSEAVRIIFAEDFYPKNLEHFLKKDLANIFLLKDHNFLKKNNIKLSNFDLLLSLPIDLLSLQELLRILFIKHSFFMKSKILIKDYEIDSNQKLIKKINKVVKLTEIELKIILLLYRENALSKDQILNKIWNHKSSLDTHAFETNLHRLRKKIFINFNDNNFITEKGSLYFISKKDY